jgi:hypothetical protein
MRIHYSVRVTVAQADSLRLEFLRSLPEGNILSVVEQVPDLLAGSSRHLESATHRRP